VSNTTECKSTIEGWFHHLFSFCLHLILPIYSFHDMNHILRLPWCIAIGISLFVRPRQPWSFTTQLSSSNCLHFHSSESREQEFTASVRSFTLFIFQLVPPPQFLSSTPFTISMAVTKTLKRPAEEAVNPCKDQANPPKKKKGHKRSCVVCDTNKHYNQFPSQTKVSSHEHGANVCRPCYVRHLEVEIDSKTWDEVACPECPVKLTYSEVENMANPEDFAK